MRALKVMVMDSHACVGFKTEFITLGEDHNEVAMRIVRKDLRCAKPPRFISQSAGPDGIICAYLAQTPKGMVGFTVSDVSMEGAIA